MCVCQKFVEGQAGLSGLYSDILAALTCYSQSTTSLMFGLLRGFWFTHAGHCKHLKNLFESLSSQKWVEDFVMFSGDFLKIFFSLDNCFQSEKKNVHFKFETCFSFNIKLKFIDLPLLLIFEILVRKKKCPFCRDIQQEQRQAKGIWIGVCFHVMKLRI